MTVYEFVVRHGADFAQGAVILGVVVAGYMGWRALTEALAWNQDTASAACDAGYRALQEVEALKTRVKSLEDAAARSKQRAADKQKVRIAKVA